MADITLNRQADEALTFQYYESDGTTKRSLVGATVYFTVKPDSYDDDADDSDAIIKVNVTSHTDAATGFTTIAITDVQTNVPAKNYFYDIKVKENDDKIYTATSGRCRIVGTPTNRSN